MQVLVVYGNQNGPFKETDNTDKPLQFYAVTKKTNELMAHSYHNHMILALLD